MLQDGSLLSHVNRILLMMSHKQALTFQILLSPPVLFDGSLMVPSLDEGVALALQLVGCIKLVLLLKCSSAFMTAAGL